MPPSGGPTDPSWTDELEAVSTAVGASLTAITLLILVIGVVLQLRQVRGEYRQRREHQASTVTVTVERADETPGGVHFRWKVENQSGVPIYFSYFEVFDDDKIRWVRLGTVSERRAVGRIELGDRYRRPSSPAAEFTWPYYRLTFMDASRVFWQRDSLGRLVETSSGLPGDPGTKIVKRTRTISENRAAAIHRATSSYHDVDPDVFPAGAEKDDSGTIPLP